MPVGRPPTCDCGVCQKCKHRAYMRAYYQRMSPEERREMIAKRDPEKVRAADRARHYRHKKERLARMAAWAKANPERAAKYKREWIARNPEKRQAHLILGYAIRSGRIERQPCEVCGKKSEAHHADYSKPLDVRWLCKEHHIEEHKKMRGR